MFFAICTQSWNWTKKNYKILRYSKGFEMKLFFLSSRPALIVVSNLLKFGKYNHCFRRNWTYIQYDTVKSCRLTDSCTYRILMTWCKCCASPSFVRAASCNLSSSNLLVVLCCSALCGFAFSLLGDGSVLLPWLGTEDGAFAQPHSAVTWNKLLSCYSLGFDIRPLIHR